MEANNTICSRCVMDNTVPDIKFDDKGECNYCRIHDELDRDYPNDERGKKVLEQTVEKIKAAGKGKKYDVIIGVSGGTDSTYLCHLAKEHGLRPLAVHLDGGWDTEIAVTNIQKSLEKLDIDLYTYVVNWPEMKDLYRSCMLGSVPWPDAPTDIAILGSLNQIAAKHGVKYIWRGNNFRTEGRQPSNWTNLDTRVMHHLHKTFGTRKLKTFPNYSIFDIVYYGILRGITFIRPFYFIPYNKSEVKKFLAKKYDWVDYGGHHHESVFTRYIIGVWLPEKFGIDKRKVTLSAYVRSGEMTRDEALKELQEPAYDPKLMQEDREYIMKKLGFSEAEFQKIWNAPNKQHQDYPSYKFFFTTMSKFAEFVFSFVMPWKPMMFYRP